ncbi:MAG TPA: tRNA pseudouridine(38-40) synthase TruA [Firmicutes bacterium]|jgi:tRNA pseudouridine38-40 synthase|nr:tRNA pseudouridine(38-40) synthase TruA [Bacillota bacterium]HAV19797.1 tRNA pseudouridine(38-40) synthase TruA [Bacillota bacterium]
MRYLGTLSYDGTSYNGWQKQPDAPSIQAEVERVFSLILNTPIEVYASGRTDRGVHARGQTFHFDCDKPFVIDKLIGGFNSLVNTDIHLEKLKLVKDDFHARYAAKSKVYAYVINNGTYSPFNRRFAMHIRDKLNVDLMKKASLSLIGTHDFKDFTTKIEDDGNFIRHISSIKIIVKSNMLRFDIAGNGFMTYMVRFIVGTLVAIGQGREDASFIPKHLDQMTRNVISYKAEPQGLFLMKVNYK